MRYFRRFGVKEPCYLENIFAKKWYTLYRCRSMRPNPVQICVYHLGLFVFLPRVFLSSRVTGASPMTTHLIMRVYVRTPPPTTKTTTENGGTAFTVRSLVKYMAKSPCCVCIVYPCLVVCDHRESSFV